MNEHSDAIAVAVGKTATYSGGASAFVFGLTANELAAIGGLLVAAIGICIQWYYGRRRDRRETEYHTARLERLRESDDE